MNRRRFLAALALLPLARLSLPSRLLAYGDSVTVGDGASDHALGYANLLALRLGLLLDNRAVSSTRVADHRATIDATIFRPGDTVIFLSGYNDMRIGTPLDDYREHLRACLAAMPGAYVGDCLRMPSASYAIPPYNAGSDAQALAFSAILYQECARAGCRYVAASRNYDPARECDDKVHPNNAGHARLARVFLASIRPIAYLAEWR